MKKIIEWILIFGMLFTASCSDKTSWAGGTENTEALDVIEFIDNGELNFALVYGNISDSVFSALTSWMDIYHASGTRVNCYDEYDYAETKHAHAVFIGNLQAWVTDVEKRAFTANLKKKLRYDDFIICIYKDDLYILGGSDDATAAGVNYFALMYANAKTLPANFYYEQRSKNYDLPTMTIDGLPVNEFVIVYDADRYYAKQLAESVCDLIYRKSGYKLTVKDDSKRREEHEIMIGVTNREESKTVAEGYTEPHVHYTLKTQNGQMLLVSEGYRTDNAAYRDLMLALSELTVENYDLKLDLSGNICKSYDKEMGECTEGTDIRLMDYNIAWMLGENNTNGFSDKQRAELVIDTILYYAPDVITFNELRLTNAFPALLREMLDAYYEFPIVKNPNADMLELQQGKVVTATAVKKGCGIMHVTGGVEQTAKNDNFHTAAWSIMQTAKGQKFICFNVHFLENKANGGYITTYAQIVLDKVAELRREYGDLPIVMAGDWYFWQGILPYNHIISGGFQDVSETALHKYSPNHGSINHLYDGTTGTELDIIFYTPEHWEALAHKIPLDYATRNGSDHFPVLADLKFK